MTITTPINDRPKPVPVKVTVFPSIGAEFLGADPTGRVLGIFPDVDEARRVMDARRKAGAKEDYRIERFDGTFEDWKDEGLQRFDAFVEDLLRRQAG